ncbi:MAG: O-antigen ligase family protein [Anaerolineae bacterium]|nr:O-antigen ligase family protein [Anaerolineae bacterium]
MKFSYDWKNQTIQQMSIAALCGLVLGLFCLFLDPRLVMVGVFGLLGAAILIRYPELGILTIIIFLSTVINEESMPVIDVGPLMVYITDVITIWLFIILVVRMLVDPEYELRFNKITLPLLLFFLWSATSTTIRVIQGSSGLNLGNAVQEFRIIAYYMVFFILINLIRDEKQLNRLLNGLFLLATITSLTNIAQYALGQNFTFLSGRVEPFSGEDPQFSNVTRITDNPGEGLITTSFIVLTVKLFQSKFTMRNIARFVQWVIVAGALLISFNRTHWGVAAISVLITFLMTKPERRKQILTWALYLSWIIPLVLIPAFIAPQSEYGQLINASLLRISTVFSPEAYTSTTESTIVWRNFEYDYGLPQIANHPLFGLGLGSNYRPFIEGIDYTEFQGQGYTHNGHLWIAMKTGLVGWFFFLTFLITFITNGFRNWRAVSNPRMQTIYLGFTLVGLSILLASILHPIVMTIFWTPVIGTFLGINDVIFRLYGSEESSVQVAAMPVSQPTEA